MHRALDTAWSKSGLASQCQPGSLFIWRYLLTVACVGKDSFILTASFLFQFISKNFLSPLFYRGTGWGLGSWG